MCRSGPAGPSDRASLSLDTGFTWGSLFEVAQQHLQAPKQPGQLLIVLGRARRCFAGPLELSREAEQLWHQLRHV